MSGGVGEGGVGGRVPLGEMLTHPPPKTSAGLLTEQT